MRLVDGEQAQPAALVQRVEHGQEARVQHTLGRGVQHHQAAGEQFALDAPRFVTVERAVEEGGVDAGLFQRAHLVVHQRDQGADHDGHAVAAAVAHDGRHLVAQALAPARGHEHQRIAAGAHVLDDFVLPAPKGAVAKHVAQHLQRLTRPGRTRRRGSRQGVGLRIVFQQEGRGIVQGRRVIGHGRRRW